MFLLIRTLEHVNSRERKHRYTCQKTTAPPHPGHPIYHSILRLIRIQRSRFCLHTVQLSVRGPVALSNGKVSFTLTHLFNFFFINNYYLINNNNFNFQIPSSRFHPHLAKWTAAKLNKSLFYVCVSPHYLLYFLLTKISYFPITYTRYVMPYQRKIKFKVE